MKLKMIIGEKKLNVAREKKNNAAEKSVKKLKDVIEKKSVVVGKERKKNVAAVKAAVFHPALIIAVAIVDIEAMVDVLREEEPLEDFKKF